MERSEVIAAAAQRLRAQHLPSQEEALPALAFVRKVCAACQFFLQVCPRDAVMLRGAHARLQFWAADLPEAGGNIWVAADKWNDDPTFAAYAIAHELGHFVLHCGEGRAVFHPCDGEAVNEDGDDALLPQRPQSVEEYSPVVRREREANLFAAELLAPRVLVRRLFTEERFPSAEIATRLGISPRLAERRLLSAILAPSRPRDFTADTPATPEGETAATSLLARLDEHQRAAAMASGPALVVAGPGTGKTATLIGRVEYLLTQRGRQPEQVLGLTFSNAAAGEMRERLMRVGLPGERMPVMTIHAFATSLLREYASRVPYGPGEAPLARDFRLLDSADQYLLLEELLPDLPLHYYRALGQPTRHLPTLLRDFSAARDALLTPDAYRALVNGMPLAPDVDAEGDDGAGTKKGKAGGKAKAAKALPSGERAYTREEIARARERAEAYRVYDRALRARGLLDFGGLIQRAVELLLADEAVLANVRGRYPEVLVDEFQDTNHAAGELILLLAGAGHGLWVVGDANQSIYRWRGASPQNLTRLQASYPTLATHRLLRNYRSVPEIVALASHMAEQMYAQGAQSGVSGTAPASAPRPVALQPDRDRQTPGHLQGTPAARAVALATGETEHAYLAEAIRAARASGYDYRDQALLCATHKQVREVASALDAAGVPVAMVGEVFAREEVKDALCLLKLAAGSDGGPLLRAGALLSAAGGPRLPRPVLSQVVSAFSRARVSLPYALTSSETVRQVLASGGRALPVTVPGGADVLTDVLPEVVSGETVVSALVALGQVATRLRHAGAVGLALARVLVQPCGYAWRLACCADSIATGTPSRNAPSPAEAQTALAALGALVSLALGFDSRWANEPDFKARLSRAARQGTTGFARPTQSRSDAQPDALEAPAADAQPSATQAHSTPGQSGSRYVAADVTEATPAVAAFLHYLDALRAASVSVTVPAPEDDTVRVMTLHASKGLEFPVVYLPYLVQGRFPAKKGGRDDACPPGFRELDAPGQEEAEQRCLFYVGVTRARDQIVLTRAERYDHKATRSTLLSLVDGAETLSGAALGGATATSAPAPLGDDAEDDEPPLPAVPVVPGRPLPTYRLWELELYHECPRKYKYAREYRFYDAKEGAVLRWHRFVRQGQRVLREARASDPAHQQQPFEAVVPQLQAAWREHGPVGHAYEDYYWRHAEGILQQEWVALAAAAPESTGALAREVVATLGRCRVVVTADEMIEEPGTALGARPRFTLVRQRTGLPAQSHRDDLALPLYILALRQEHPGAEVRVVLRYLGNALRSDDLSEHSGETVDLTEEATRAAERYARPDRKARSALDKLDEAADRIQVGLFPPDPDEHKCAGCAFAYLCPADPEEALPARALLPSPHVAR